LGICAAHCRQFSARKSSTGRDSRSISRPNSAMEWKYGSIARAC
jgi:hypothetical protein